MIEMGLVCLYIYVCGVPFRPPFPDESSMKRAGMSCVVKFFDVLVGDFFLGAFFECTRTCGTGAVY